MEHDLQHFRDRLEKAHANARRMRSEAFVRYSPIVAGQRLTALTLDTYNLLIAWENPFVVGGICEFHHLAQFVWAHSPEFSQFNDEARKLCVRNLALALLPNNPNLSDMARALSPLPKMNWLARFIEPTAKDLETAAIEECSRIVSEGIGDFPTDKAESKEEAPSEPLPFPLQAQILNTMRRELGVPFSETRSMPLKELAQHLREMTWTASKGKSTMLTTEESEVWADYQAWREAQAKREKT